MKYDVQWAHPGGPEKSPEELAKYIRDVRLIGPHGERIEAQGNGWHADPRWSKVTAEFDLEDPSAPPEVAGPFEDTLEFKDLPMPQQLDKPLDVGRSATTLHGARFVIEKAITRIVEEDDGGMQGELAFSLAQRSTPGVSLSAWSVSPSASIRVVRLMDADGTDLTDSLVDKGSIRPDKAFPGRMVFRIRPLPPKTQSLTVQVGVKDKPQRLPETLYHHFRLQLPMPAIPPPTDNSYKPSRTAIGKIADVTLEKVLVEKFGQMSQYSARVWVQDKQKKLPPPQQRDWIFRRSAVRWLRGGNEVESDLSRPDPVRDAAAERIYWKANGMPIEPNEVGLRMGSFASQEARPRQFTYEFTLEAVRKVRHQFNFANVPIPKPGEVLEPNVASTDVTGAQLVVRRVGYIRDQAAWMALHPGWTGNAPPDFFGLVVVCALERSSDGMDGSKATAVLSANAAKDSMGETLLSRPDTPSFSIDLLTQKKDRTYNDGTFVLLPAAAGAKSFNMQVAAEETLPTGEQETFVLPDVDVPQQ